MDGPNTMYTTNVNPMKEGMSTTRNVTICTYAELIVVTVQWMYLLILNTYSNL
jgi:hypothetical protein